MKRSFRYRAARGIAKIRLLIRKSDTIAASCLKMSPDFLAHVKRPKTVIAIIEADHDASCRNLIADILGRVGKNVVCNDGDGAESIVDLFLRSGKKPYDPDAIYLLMVDASDAAKILPTMHPDLVMIHGLTEADAALNESMEMTTINRLNHLLDAPKIATGKKETYKVVLCGDDVISRTIAPDQDRVLYGVERLEQENSNLGAQVETIPSNRLECPICGAKLAYEFLRFGKLGKVVCASCGYQTPEAEYLGRADFEARAIAINGVSYWLLQNDMKGAYTLSASVAVLSELGIDQLKIRSVLKDMDREEEEKPEQEASDVVDI